MLRHQLHSCGARLLFMAFFVGAGLPSIAWGLSVDLVASMTGPASGDQLGFSVDGAGDFNGDGYPDLIVGLPYSDAAGADAGRAMLFYGGPGWDMTPDLVFVGEAAGDAFGYAVRGAGDVNDDGYDDVMVGAPFNDAAGANAGRAYVFFGGAAPDAVADLVLTGETAGDQFGQSVDGAGDLDGGGDDLVVGAPYNHAAGTMAGRAYVFEGGAALDDTADVVMQGPAGSLFGWSVARAGDLDGDGDSEVAVGAILTSTAYVYFGSPGFDALPELSLAGERTDDRFGYTIACAGDFNHDGYDDLVIGAIHNDAAAEDAGRAYLYHGGPSPDASFDLKFTGEGYRDLFGRALAGPGDLNGDGIDDLVVGAPTPDTGGYGPGRVYVFLGGQAGTPQPPDNKPDLMLTGENPSDRFGCHINGIGDIDGDGRREFALGANLFSVGASLRYGKVCVLGAENDPPLTLADAETTLVGVPVSLPVLANDTDADGWIVTASLAVVTPPAHGTATVDTVSGLLDYEPAPGFAGADTLAYVVADNLGALSAPTLATVGVQDLTPPAPPTLVAARPGHQHVLLSWQDPAADVDHIEVWRAIWPGAEGGSAYPLYDGAGTVPPTRPANRDSAAAGGVWTLVGIAAAGAQAWSDSVCLRGVYDYELYAIDGAGNPSGPAANGARSLNYRLGDLPEPGNGVVDSLDLELFRGQLGLTAADTTFMPAADIGPTDDGTPGGVPITDGVVDFEDLMIAAADYLLSDGYDVLPVAPEPVALAWHWVDEHTLALHLTAPQPDCKGLRVTTPLPAGSVASVTAGTLLAAQSHPCFVANVDAAGLDLNLVVLGAGVGLDGSGELCRIVFTDSLPSVDPSVQARALDNTPLPATIAYATDVPAAAAARVELHPNWPNPFNPLTRLQFVLPQRARVRMAIYALNGALVRTLIAEELPAGVHEAIWNGRDDRGANTASGVYLCRLEASGTVLSRRLTLLK